MKKMKNITRYESGMGKSYSFTGWRLCIARKSERFVRYFSDREYGGDAERSFAAAMEMRDAIITELGAGKDAPAEVFTHFRKVYSPTSA